MAIDKTIDYVIQDGYNNYTKNSKSVTVPKKFKARKNAPATKLAYITEAEAKQLKKQNPGTPHKGPSGIPSYDSFDAQGNYSSGAAQSAAETGGSTDRDRRDMAQAGISPQEAQAIRSAAINAGAGQRVNPGFFDSRTNLTPAETKAAKAARRDPNNLYGAKSFRNTGQSGIMNLIRSGGLLGSLARGIGQFFGLGKKPGEATYDMSEFSDIGLLSDRINPIFQNDLGNELMLSTQKTPVSTQKTPERFLPNAGPKPVNIPAGDAVSTLASSKLNRMKGYTDDYPNLGLIPSKKEIPTVNDVPMINTGSVYQDNLNFFDNLNKGLVVNNEPPMVNTDNVMQGSVLDAKPKKGIMQMISDAFISPAGADEFDMEAFQKAGADKGFFGANDELEAMKEYYDAAKSLSAPGSKFAGATNPNEIRSFIETQSNIPFGGGSYGVNMDMVPTNFMNTTEDFTTQKDPLTFFADGGLASMFTRRG
jgi:hypothetical protein